MFDREAPRVKLSKDWRPPDDFDPKTTFRQKSAFRHISKEDEPDGTNRDRVRLHLNEVLSEAEKGKFGHLMHTRHREWFGCACWGSQDSRLTVRISIKNNEHLADARLEVGKHADLILQEILAERQKKK